ncbi:MAG: hypothetical protein KF718_33595 [Polyangiaceae bacterium]|nr:hypothetical protein [Polyangiaceae bacterium]
MTEYDSVADAPSRRHQRDTDELGWYVPDFVRLQTGGFVGLVAVGVGYAAFDDVLNVSAHYGFTPASLVGTTVHAASLEILIRPFDQRLGDFRVVPIYVGPGLLYTGGEGFFTRVPEQYSHIDSNYYPPSSLYWTARVGVELDYVPPAGFFERHGVYYEATLFSAYLNLYRKNPDTLAFENMFGGAVGYRGAF